MNIHFLSDHIIPVYKRVKFCFIVLWRIFQLLVRRKIVVKLLNLDYCQKYNFNQGFLILRYSFQNALWYECKNILKTTDPNIIVLNLERIKDCPIELIVHGLFNKKSYPIEIEIRKSLDPDYSHATIDDFSLQFLNTGQLHSMLPSLVIKQSNQEVKFNKIRLKEACIQIKQIQLLK